MVDVRVAARTDRRLGIREEVGFYGTSGEEMFGAFYRPLRGSPTGSVLICTSIHAELLAAYRNEVVLARSLASAGVAVHRFHYRGVGHSAGDTGEATLESMIGDAGAAADRLVDRVGIPPTAIVGTRWGALVAAVTSTRRGGVPLVLWEPFLEGERFFREAFRAARMSALTRGSESGEPGERPVDQLRRTGLVDVLGYPISLPLYESGRTTRLDDALGPQPRPILLVQIDRARELRGDYARAIAGWQRRGCAVETRLVAAAVAWWLDSEPSGTAGLVGSTREWLLRRLARGAA